MEAPDQLEELMGERTGWLGYVEPFATAAAVVVAVLVASDARKSAARQDRETERQRRALFVASGP